MEDSGSIFPEESRYQSEGYYERTGLSKNSDIVRI
jgi:hypothetical protein